MVVLLGQYFKFSSLAVVLVRLDCQHATKKKYINCRMDDKKLIDLVRTHECLYNMHSRQYKDDIMKTNCWRKIADELGVSMSCPDPGEYFDVMKC